MIDVVLAVQSKSGSLRGYRLRACENNEEHAKTAN